MFVFWVRVHLHVNVYRFRHNCCAQAQVRPYLDDSVHLCDLRPCQLSITVGVVRHQYHRLCACARVCVSVCVCECAPRLWR